MAAPPAGRERMSSRAVSAFIATRMSISFLRATYPCLLARMVYQVGKPAIFDGKRFLPLMGIPIAKILFSRTLFADCDPEPFTVATWMLKSLTTSPDCPAAARGCSVFRATSPVAIEQISFQESQISAGPNRRHAGCHAWPPPSLKYRAALSIGLKQWWLT